MLHRTVRLTLKIHSTEIYEKSDEPKDRGFLSWGDQLVRDQSMDESFRKKWAADEMCRLCEYKYKYIYIERTNI